MKRLLVIVVFTFSAVLSKGQNVFYADRFGDLSYDQKDSLIYGEQHKLLIKISYDTSTDIIEVSDGAGSAYHIHEKIADTTMYGFHMTVWSAFDKNRDPCFIKVSFNLNTDDSEMDVVYVDKKYGYYYMINNSIKF